MSKYGEFETNNEAFLTVIEESCELELKTEILMDGIQYLNGIRLKFLNAADSRVIKEIKRSATLIACDAIRTAAICDKWLEKLIKVGLIFNDPPKLHCLMSSVHMGVKNSYYSLIPVELPLLESEEDMARSVIDLDIDAVIIDADLSALYTSVNLYSGVSLARRLTNIVPVFLLTMYPECKKETRNYKTFSLEKYLENPSELNGKIIEKCKNEDVSK